MSDRVDVLRYTDTDDGSDRYVAVPVGGGDHIVTAHEDERRKRNQMRTVFKWLIVAVVLSYAFLVVDNALLGGVAAIVVVIGFAAGERLGDEDVPEVVARNVTREDAVAQWDADLPSSGTPD